MVIGDTNSEIKTAIDIASSKNAKIILVESSEQAINFLCGGKGADLIFIDVKFDIKALVNVLGNEKISIPIVAYGVHCSPREAVRAVKNGAREFMPLPPDERLIAAIFTAISDDNSKIIGSSLKIKQEIDIADKIA